MTTGFTRYRVKFSCAVPRIRGGQVIIVRHSRLFPHRLLVKSIASDAAYLVDAKDLTEIK